MKKTLKLYPVILCLFDGNLNTNLTTDSGMSGEMKMFYSDYLIDNAEPELVHAQHGQKHTIPKNGGKTIEFRKYDTLPVLTTPIKEGVTPDGQKINMGTVTATLEQYGGYATLNDVLMLTAIDNNLVEATKLLASQAGRTLDAITREELCGGTNVQYAEGQVSSRGALVGGKVSGNHYLTVKAVRMAVRTLKVMNTPKINGDYAGIIHPDCSFDLMSDPEWKYPHQYVDTENIYAEEIGKIAGVRFSETSEAKVFAGANLASDSRTLAVNNSGGYSGKITSVAFDGGVVAKGALIGRKILINGVAATVEDNTTSAITIEATDFGTVSDNAVIYPGEGGAEGRDVYATLIFGANAFGNIDIAGGGLEHIVKQLGSAGTADPLNQRATVGWKAMYVCKRLVEQFLVRVETTSTFTDTE